MMHRGTAAARPPGVTPPISPPPPDQTPVRPPATPRRQHRASATWILRVLSPTWALADWAKGTRRGPERSRIITRFNRGYLVASLVLTGVALWATGNHASALRGAPWPPPLLLLVAWLLLSRCVEVFAAFLADAVDHLDPSRRHASDLQPARRVGLALASYAEIVLDFGLLNALMPKEAWLAAPAQVTDLLFYSASTITTSGGGGFTPTSWPAQLLATFEILTGVVLLVVCFAIYTGHALSARDRTN